MLFTANRSFAQSRVCLGLGLFLAMAGAGFATGIMAYEALANDTSFTAESWILIAPLWFGLAAAWVLTTRWPLVGGIPFGALAFYTGGYFSDVYGQYPAGALLLLGAVVVVAAATGVEDSGAPNGPRRDVAPD